MLRISKLTGYGVALMTEFAVAPAGGPLNARDLSERVRLPLPTVSKILKVLAREGLLVSHRGAKGGYTLARPPAEISVAGIIGALEGPIAITECLSGEAGACSQEPLCTIRGNWLLINQAVQDTLEKITLDRMVRSAPDFEEWIERSIAEN